MNNANEALQALLEGVIGGLIERYPDLLGSSKYRVSIQLKGDDVYQMQFWDRSAEGGEQRFVYNGIYQDVKPTHVWYNWEDGKLSRIKQQRFEIPLNHTTAFNLTFGVDHNNGKPRIVLKSAVPAGFGDLAMIPERDKHETATADTADPSD